MSFGFGIGDFLATIELISKLQRNFSQAPEQYRSIATEITNASLVAEIVVKQFSDYAISDAQRQSFSVVAAGFKQALEDADKVVKQYSDLDSKLVSKLDPKLHSRIKEQIAKTWKRATFDNKEISDLRSRLASAINNLTSFVEVLNRESVTDLATAQAKAIIKIDQIQYGGILEQLAPADYAAQHSSIRERCLPSSGQWILESSEYQHWLNGNGEILYFQGMPGTGKTFLSAVIIDSIQRPGILNKSVPEPDAKGAGLCYFYCDYSQHKDEQVRNTLACFLRQLAQNTISSPLVRDTLENLQRVGPQPSLAVIRDALLLVVKPLQSVRIIVDALDEYSDTPRREELVKELLKLNQAAKVNIVVTSRILPDISKHFASCPTLEIRARGSDISAYVDTNISILPNFVKRDQALQEEIRSSIVDTADGIFLLATLNLQSLQGKRSRGHLEKTLASFKNRTLGYQDAYSKTMERISNQDQDGLAIDTLTWVVYAARPLTDSELLHALGTDVVEQNFDERLMPDMDDILTACCGLIHVEKESNVVRLVHRTAMDYLEKDGRTWLKDGHVKLSEVCTTYLTLKDVVRGDLQNLSKKYPLYGYARMFGQYHVENREHHNDFQQIVTIQQLTDEASNNLSQQAFSEYCNHSRRRPGIIGLHLVAACGLTNLVPEFLKFTDVNNEDKFYRTPVSYAVEGGHYEALCILIQRNARLNFVYESRETLLTYAVKAGFDNVVIMLIKSKSPQLDIPNKDGRTALHLAAISRNFSVLHALLEAGADPNVVDDAGCTPLILAVTLEYSEYKTDMWGCDRLKHELEWKQKRSDKNIGDSVTLMQRQNLLSAEEYTSIIQKLIASGSNLTLTDNLDRTAVWYAYQQCTTALLAFFYEYTLFEQDESPRDDTGMDGKISSLLPRTSDMSIVSARIPLDLGVYTNSYYKTSVLQAAVAGNNAEMLEWLCCGRYLKEWITSHQVILGFQLDTVQYLSFYIDEWVNHIKIPERIEGETWFNANLLGSIGALTMLIPYQTSLDSMTEDDYVKVEVEYADADSQRHRKTYPLCKKVSGDGDWFHAVDKYGQTALHMSVKRCRVATAKYLLKNGLDRFIRDSYGRTVLEYACLADPETGIFDVIWDPGFCDMVARDNTWSPLHWACRFGDFPLLSLLVKAGFRATTVSTQKPNADWSPLDVALFCQNRHLVKYDNSLNMDWPCNWESLPDCGLVTRDKLSGKVVPVLKNHISRVQRDEGGLGCSVCSEVSKPSQLILFNCRTCGDKTRYCLFCKHDGSALHPEHEWVLY